MTKLRDDISKKFAILRGKDVKPARSKRDSRQATTHVDHLLFQLVDDMHSIWDGDSFLDRAQKLVKKAIESVQNIILQSLAGVAQSKKERRQEDDSANSIS